MADPPLYPLRAAPIGTSASRQTHSKDESTRSELTRVMHSTFASVSLTFGAEKRRALLLDVMTLSGKRPTRPHPDRSASPAPYRSSGRNLHAAVRGLSVLITNERRTVARRFHPLERRETAWPTPLCTPSAPHPSVRLHHDNDTAKPKVHAVS